MQEKGLIFILLLSWFIVHFEPFQAPVRKLFKPKYLISYWIRSLLTCWFCLSTWLTFSYFYQLGEDFKECVFNALVNGFAAWFITKITTK